MTGILFVCEGNICRSPLAAMIVAKALESTDTEPLSIRSVGVRAVEGAPMDRRTIEIAEDLGLDPSGHSARQVTATDLARASVVLTATRAQRSGVVRIHPRTIKYAFTIRQLGRVLHEADQAGQLGSLSGGSHIDRLESLLSLVVARRGLSFQPHPEEDDIVDPHGRPRSVHQAAARQMIPSLDRLSRVLRQR